MTGLRRPLALAAVLFAMIGTGVAHAQTFIVRHAPPATTIELVFSGATTTATTNAAGDMSLAVKNAVSTARDVRIAVDTCGNLRRIVLAERYGQMPVAAEGCDRKEIPGFFVMQSVTTFVLDLGGSTPTVWLRQGPAPAGWLTQSSEELSAAPSGRSWRQAPAGLVMGGSAGFTTLGFVSAQACGNVTDCNQKNDDFSFSVNVGFWLTRFLAAEGSFIRPSSFNIVGSGTGYRFNTNFNPYLWTIVGKGGVPIGPVRPYGMAGMNYHQATSSTANTIEDRTVTLDDGTTVTIPGGTQTYDLKTQGWGWLFGGGMEAWVGRRVAIFGEVSRAQVKGTSSGSTFGVNDRVTIVLAGARVSLWGPS